MIGYRVENVRRLIKLFPEEGHNVVDKIGESEFETFAWEIASGGSKVALWRQPEGQ
jgi:hypothetical protein